jgi:exonuclease VII small subunit
MARMDKQTATKAAIAIEFTKQRQLLEERIKELELEIVDRDNTIKELRRGVNLLGTEDDIKKKILAFRSRMYSPIKIHESLQYIGIDVEVETIKDIVNNIESLSPELKLYYSECIDSYESEVKINPQLLKQASLDGIMFLMDECLSLIKNSTDAGEKDRFMKSYNEYIKTKTALLKDVVLGIEDKDASLNILDNTMDEYRVNANKLIKLSINSEDIATIRTIS